MADTLMEKYACSEVHKIVHYMTGMEGSFKLASSSMVLI